MSDFGDAYYPIDIGESKKSVPEGRYQALIIDLELSKDVQFYKYIADVFKPTYCIVDPKFPELLDETVKDNGIFRYKKVDGYEYEHSKNWGYAKFISMIKTSKKDGKGNQLPFLFLSDVKNKKMLIDVTMKKFKNETGSDVSYPVARAIQIIEDSEVPF